VDGQVLVSHDMLGINKDFSPSFYVGIVTLYNVIKEAVEQYITDVKSVDFPNEKEQY
jgi:3-methyl-2-oxobutanoate hydroxymethyltransferase